MLLGGQGLSGLLLGVGLIVRMILRGTLAVEVSAVGARSTIVLVVLRAALLVIAEARVRVLVQVVLQGLLLLRELQVLAVVVDHELLARGQAILSREDILETLLRNDGCPVHIIFAHLADLALVHRSIHDLLSVHSVVLAVLLHSLDFIGCEEDGHGLLEETQLAYKLDSVSLLGGLHTRPLQRPLIKGRVVDVPGAARLSEEPIDAVALQVGAAVFAEVLGARV